MRRNTTVIRIIAGMLVALMVGSLLFAAVIGGTTSDDGAPVTTSGQLDVADIADQDPAPLPPAAQPAGEPVADTSGTDPPPEATAFPENGPSGLPAMSWEALPEEAWQTLLLIDDGGPYPYRQDDSTFQNREGILPDREPGHYREYTVDTPGSPDRGARRIVTGADGEVYYTDDHYGSFAEVVDW